MAVEALTGVGATGARGTVSPNLRIGLTGVSATGRTGLIHETVGLPEGFDLLAPAVQLALTGVAGAVGELDFNVLLPRLALTGDTPVPATVELTAPAIQFVASGVTGAVGTLVLRAPEITVSFGQSDALQLQLPLPTLALSGNTGDVAQLQLRQLLPVLTLVGRTETIGTLTLASPRPRLTMEMVSGRTGALAVTTPPPILAMSGAVGTTGTLTLEAPAPQLRLVGHYAAVGVLAIETPAITLAMSGVTTATAAQIEAARLTHVLQTERMALTKYTNFPFNSFAVFDGRYFGASTGGIYELTGSDDAGTDIQAAARFGITDLGSSYVKRLDTVYVGYRTGATASALLLRAWTNETQQRDYAVGIPRTAGLHMTRVPLGKGVESRYWQFELRNRDGADFELDTLELQPTRVRRRVGAKDA